MPLNISVLSVLFLVLTSYCDEVSVSSEETANVLENSGDVVFSENLKATNEVLLNDSLSVEKSNLNETSNETSPVTNNRTKSVECEPRVLPENEVPTIMVSDGNEMLKVLSSNGTNSTVGECIIVLFFSSQCVFSARIAPHYNALARVFPGIALYALDTLNHKTVHIRYGVVAVPTVLLFHNGKLTSRFNSSQMSLHKLANFVTKYTNLKFNDTLNVTSADMTGPVPAILVKSVDFVLILAWAFTIFCVCLWFLKSSLCHRIVECIRNTWLEAEAQHEHAD